MLPYYLFISPDEKTYSSISDKRIKVISLGKTKPGFSIKHIFKIASFVRKNSFDIVHFHGFFHYHFLSVILNHTRTKIFYTVHNDADRENTYWEKKMLQLKRYCFQKRVDDGCHYFQYFPKIVCTVVQQPKHINI